MKLIMLAALCVLVMDVVASIELECDPDWLEWPTYDDPEDC